MFLVAFATKPALYAYYALTKMQLFPVSSPMVGKESRNVARESKRGDFLG